MTISEPTDQKKKKKASTRLEALLLQSKTENTTEVQETSAVNKITSLKLNHQY